MAWWSNARCYAAVLVGIAIRAVLISMDMHSTFANSNEIITPMNDFRRVLYIAFIASIREGIYLMNVNVSAYAGSTVHHPPLVIALFNAILTHLNPLALDIVFIAIDVICAVVLYQIACVYQDTIVVRDVKEGAIVQDEARFVPRDLPSMLATIYILNPYTLLACVAHSTSGLEYLAVYLMILSAMQLNVVYAAFTCAIATYLGLYHFGFLPLLALVMAHFDSRSANILKSTAWLYFAKLVFFFALFMSALAALSFYTFNSWEFLEKGYLYHLMVEDLQPNIGLFWYYLAESFPNFRTFFVMTFQYHVFIYILPMIYTMSHHPVFLVWLQLGIVCIFKAYPSAGDIAFYLCMIPLFLHKIQRIEWGFAMAGALVYLTFLYPIIWRMWIEFGSGNANFYYALNLVTALVQGFMLTEAMNALKKRDFLISMKRSLKAERNLDISKKEVSIKEDSEGKQNDSKGKQKDTNDGINDPSQFDESHEDQNESSESIERGPIKSLPEDSKSSKLISTDGSQPHEPPLALSKSDQVDQKSLEISSSDSSSSDGESTDETDD